MPPIVITPPGLVTTPPGFLVTVIDALEVPTAIRGGADVLDVKDPGRGALGAPRLETVRAVARLRDAWTARRLVLSVALGDRADRPSLPARAAAACRAGADVVKIGVLGLGDARRARAGLRGIVFAVREARPTASVVAACFADRLGRAALSPECLAGIAAEAGAAGLLIDTADKRRGSLLAHMTPAAVREVVAAAHGARLFVALAGSLAPADVEALLGAPVADYLGARGSLCRGGRGGRLDLDRVRRFGHALRSLGVGPNIGPRPQPNTRTHS